MNATELIGRVNSLANDWQTRQASLKRWYNVIRLVNDLHQDNMESVISSDPRTGFSMASWLLKPKVASYVADTEGFTDQQQADVSAVENYCYRQYVSINRQGRGTLHGPFINRLVGLMLATGWYSVISYPTDHGWVMNAWNPAGVFPRYNSSGQLVEVARRYRVSAEEARIKLSSEGWQYNGRLPDGNHVVYTRWWYEDGYVMFGSAINNQIVSYGPTPFSSIPVFVAPVSGLPDDGTITDGQTWRADIGASLVSSVADIQKNYDKMLTYMQQLIRDVANPRFIEHTKAGPAANPDDLYKRGAVFNYQPDEDLGPMPTLPIPPEVRTHEFDLRGQIQRATFSDIAFGSVTQQVSAYMMSQVTAVAQLILDPFHTAVKDCLGQIATQNVQAMRDFDLRLDNQPIPSLPELVNIDFNYDIQIPGDLLQRANAARILNPSFKLSRTSILAMQFPEVQSALQEEARVKKEEAMDNPVFAAVLAIQELSRAAQDARDHNDEASAQRLDQAAKLLDQQLSPQPTQQPNPNQSALPQSVEEVLRSINS